MKKKYETIELPDLKGCKKTLKEVFSKPEAQPEAVHKLLKMGTESNQETHAATGLRMVKYKGRMIEIKTTYEIKIDGKPFTSHVAVDEDGHLHCHSIPYETYGSAVDFVRSVIDIYPDSFPTMRTQP